MESMNSLKGYGKVDPVENDKFRRKTLRRVAVVAVFTVLLIALVVGTVVGVILTKNNKHSESPPPPTNTVQTLCALATYPDSCYSTFSLANSSDPQALLKLSLKSAYDSLSGAKDLPDKLSVSATREIVRSSLSDCKDMIVNALDTLNDALSSVDGSQLSLAKVDDLKTWLSSAITARETCLDSLKEGKDASTLEKIRSATQNFTELASNSLAIVSKGFGLLSVKNRKLLAYERRFRRWLREEDRRFLQSSVITGIDLTLLTAITSSNQGDITFKNTSELPHL